MMGEKQEVGVFTIRNYGAGICGVIDEYPMFVVTYNPLAKELTLKSHKYRENMKFASFAEFEEYMKNRKDDDQ